MSEERIRDSDISQIVISIKNDGRGNLKEVQAKYEGNTPYVRLSYELLEDIFYEYKDKTLEELNPLWFAGFYLMPIEIAEKYITFERMFWRP